MRGFLYLCLLLIVTGVRASEAESARMLVHTLNYLSSDYGNAVKGGKVVNAEEYEEMGEFCENANKYFSEYAKGWKKEDSAEVAVLIGRISLLVEQKAPADSIAAVCRKTNLKIIAATGLKTYPTSYPDIEKGKKIFAAECTKCHGKDGYGDGPEGLELDPKPRNFHDNTRMQFISASHIFNTVRLGVEGTGMVAIPYLEDEEVWDVAFYVLSLRHQGQKTEALNQEIPLEKIATSSDAELLAQGISQNRLAALRTSVKATAQNTFLSKAMAHLNDAEAFFKSGDYRKASDKLSLAYLEGVEPIEMELNATDPELKEDIEHSIQQLRKLIKEKASAERFTLEIAELTETLHKAEQLLQGKEYSFVMAFLMTISILLREGLEAFLIIMVMLSVLRAASQKSSKTVHAGWLTAVFTGVALWFIMGELIPQNIQKMELLESGISLLAVAMLLYVGFWLHSKSEAGKWKAYVTNMMNGAISGEGRWGLFALSFFVTFREVFESVLFLSALHIESGGSQSLAIVSGVVMAFAIVLLLAFIVMKFSARLPVPRLFKISSVVMAVLAVVLMGKAIHSLQEVGVVAVHACPVIRIEMLGIYPTWESVSAQLVVALIVFFISSRKP